MLSCSLRVGPTVDGQLRIWHLEEKAGANVVVTCPPSLIDECINFPDAESIKFKPNQIEVDPPQDVMDKLLRIPYFARAYDENGYTREEYATHPALVKTHAAFSKATQEMVDFAGNCLKGSCAPTPAS
jgi:transaldolase